MADSTNNATPQEQAQLDAAYAAKVAYETDWPAKQAANTAAMNQRAAAAATQDKASKARQSFPNVKYTRAKGAK